MYKKMAITLAEFLVVIMIIGVVSALAIPGMKQTAQDRANVSMLKKAYATLSTATRTLRSANGPIKYWDFSSKEKVATLYKAKINTNVIHPESYTVKNDESGNVTINTQDMFNAQTSFFSIDGILWFISDVSSDCSATFEDKSYCAQIGVDVNGEEGPNTIGKDIYSFYITINSVYPDALAMEKMDMKDTQIAGGVN